MIRIRRTVLVDGYNVIKRDPVLVSIERRGLQAAREALLARLLSSYDLRTCDVVVVFDGQGPAETTEGWGKVRIIYSRSGQTADEVIARLSAAARDPSQVVAISDDRSVRDSVTRVGGQAAGSADRRQPRAGDKERPDGQGKDDEGQQRGREKKGNPRRAPRRPRQGGAGFRW